MSTNKSFHLKKISDPKIKIYEESVVNFLEKDQGAIFLLSSDHVFQKIINNMHKYIGTINSNFYTKENISALLKTEKDLLENL